MCRCYALDDNYDGACSYVVRIADGSADDLIRGRGAPAVVIEFRATG